jgi:large repetitive protein
MKSTLFPRHISQINKVFYKAKYKDLFFKKCHFAIMMIIGILMSGLVSGQTTVNIYPADLNFSSGYVTSAGSKFSGDMQVSTSTTYGRGWIKFPLNSIPSNAIISDVTISFYFYTGATSSAQNTIRGFYGDPVTMAGTTLYNDIGAGSSYNSSTWDINTWNTRVLTGAAAYVQNQISTGYVNFGFFRGSSNLHGIYGYTNATYKPYITVTYTVPSCSGTPNGGTATVDSNTSVTVCAGSQVELQATGYSHSMLGLSSIWQSSSTSGGPWSDISGAVSDTYVTTVSTDTYFRYYTTCSNSGLSAATNEVSVTATVIQAPTVSNEVIVCGETATLSASGSPDGYIWFEDAAGTIQIGTGSDIDVSPAVTTTYYVASSYGSQSNSYGESFDAMSLPAGWSNSNNQSDVSANAFWKFSPTGIDYGMAGTTDHTGNGGTFAWVDGSSPSPIIVTLTSPLYPQESYTDLTFFMKRNTTGYDTNPMNTFTLDFYDGSTWHNAVFTHTSNTASGNWEQFVVPLNSFTISGQVQYRINVNKNGAITYYDDIAVDDFQLNSGGSYCLSVLVPVQVTVNSIPDPTASDATINCGEAATLTASGSPADYTWYSDAGGTTVVANGSVFTTPLLASDMTYYVASTYAGMCVSNLIPVTVTVIPLYDPVATDATINCGETATLTASGSQAGYTWYSDAAGTQVVGTGSPFTTPVLADNTTYYVASTSGGLCISNLVPSVVTVTPLPEPVVSDTSAYCGVTTTLTATGSPLDYIWFEDAAGTVVLGTGPTLDVIPVSTATYYVASTGGQSTGQTYTFTNCGATGRFGPTQSQLDNTYSGTNLDGLVTIFTQGIQQWQVPSTGTYQIEAYGAQGGGDSQTGSRAGGRGARMTGEFNLNQGDILRIIAGQTGLINGTVGGTGNRGGGGGSFIWNVNGNALLLAAGGGGGTNVSTTNTVGNDAVVGLNGTVLSHGGGSPGTNGNGGNPGAAGWLTNGSNIQGTAVPLRPLNGGVGGQGYNDQASHDGGFGGGQGGGGNPSTTQASGGGGGYSGGAGQTTPAGFGGGGGGSYNSGLNQNNASGINTGHGYVLITSPSGALCMSNLVPVTVTVLVLPDPVASDATINCGETATLTASGSPADYTWYSDAGGTNVIGTGSTFVTPMLNDNNTYYVASTSGPSCSSNLIPVQVSVIPLPDPVASGVTINCGEAATLTASGSPHEYTWYSDAGGTTVVATGSVFTTPLLATDMTYYVASTYAGMCVSNLIPVSVTVIPLYDPVATDATINCGETATLTASGSQAGYTWYSDAAGTQVVGTGSTYVTPMLNDNATYYVASTSGSLCISNLIPSHVTVIPLPDPSSNDTTIYCGATVTLTATGSPAEYTWYSDAGATTEIGTGPQFTTPALSDTTTYYVASTAGASTSFIITEICHFKTPTGQPTAGWPSYLLTDDYIEITGVPGSSLGGYTLEQWDGSTMLSTHTFGSGVVLSPNGTAIIAVGQMGSSVESPSNYYYHGDGGYSTSFSSGGAAGRILKDPFGVIVDAVGYPGGTSGYSFPPSSGVTPDMWSGNVPDATSTSGIRLIGPHTSSSANWVVSSSTYPQNPNAQNSGVAMPSGGPFCSSNLIPVTVNIETLPDPVASDATINCGETATLTASGSPADYTWYSDAGGTNVIGTGSTFVTPMLNDDITYYVASTSGPFCSSNLIPVQVSVIPLPDPVASDATINCGESATLTASGSPHEYTWYSDAGGTTVVATGSVFTTPLLATDMTYYVASTYAGMCVSNLIPVAVTVIPLYDPVATDATINCGETATLTASGSQAGYTWYSDATGTQVVGTGSAYVTPMLNDNTTYYVASTSGSLCISNLIPSHVTVIPLSDPSSNDTTIYCGATVTLTATGSPAEYTWYADAGGTTEVGTGPQFTTPALSDTTTYYVASTAGASTSFIITEICQWRNSSVGNPTGGWPSYLIADDYIEITGVPGSSLGGYTLEQWDATSIVSSHTFGSGVVLSPSGTAIIAVGEMGSSSESPSNYYYHGNGGFSSSFSSGGGNGRILKDPFGLIIDAVAYPGSGTYAFPPSAGVTPDMWSGNVSPAGSTSGIRLIGPHTSSSANWVVSSSTYPQNPNAQNAGVAMPSGGPFCSSNLIPVTVNIETLPDPVASDATINCGETATLIASGSPADYTWYSDAGGINVVGTGSTFVSPMLNDDITYYVASTSGPSCSSNLIPVQVSVIPLPDPVASNATINCGESATLTASGSPHEYTWYSDAGGTTVVATGSVFTTPLLATDMTYYVASTYAGMCVSNLIPVAVTVIPLYDPVATDATINCGETATLTASGSQAGYTWYSDASGTQVVGTGSTYVTPMLNDNTTYYVASTSGSLCISNLIPSHVTVIPLSDPSSNDTTIYCGATVTLTATGSPAEYTWYADAGGTSEVGTGPQFTTPALSDTTTYYVASTAGASTSFIITEICHYKTPTGQPTAGWPSYLLTDDYIEITGVPGSSLGGYTLEQWDGSTMLSTHTFGSGVVLSPNGTAIIAVGQMGSSVESPSNYYYHGDGGYSTSFSSGGAAGRILKDPFGVIVDAVGYPGGTSGYSFPPSSGVTPDMWSGNVPDATSTSGIRLIGPHTSSSANWVVSSSTYPQNPNAQNSGVALPSGGPFCSSNLIPVTVNIETLPDPVALDAMVNCGETATLTASGSPADYTWYSDAGGINVVGTGSTFVTPMLNDDITYYVASTSGPFCSSNLIPVQVSVIPLPDPVASDATINCGESATLTASGSPHEYTWYSDAGGTTVVATGSVFTTPLLATDMTYYVASTYAGMCVSNLIPVAVTVIPLYDPVATDATINCGETATLTASGSQAGYTWYSDATGTQVVGTGSTYVTPMLNDNTTYYVASTSGSLCISNLIPSHVTVIPLSDPSSNDTTIYCGATVTLTATGSPAEYTWFADAGGTIRSWHRSTVYHTGTQ